MTHRTRGTVLPDRTRSAIFIGHGHFDHAADAGRVAQACGAVVHGTAEHCANIAAQVTGPAFPTVAHYEAPLRAELERIAAPRRPELRALHDPEDYLRPQRLTFAL